jgi:hypothetical protein
MTISIIRNSYSGLASAATVAAMLWSWPVLAQDDAGASPHWNERSCEACHVDSAPTDGVVNLQAADAEALCETCHGSRGEALPCRHASGIPAGESNIAESLAGSLKNGQVVCTTCHDIVFQCERPKKHYSLQNPGFLRDRTSHASSDYCLKCHDVSGIEKLTPHAGVAGSPPRPTCPLCHTQIPSSGPDGKLLVEFNMGNDLDEVCLGCHTVNPHPRGMSFGAPRDEEGWVHLVKPSENILDKIRQSQAETGIGLPLHPQTGEVICATCHNPHDFKIGGEHGSAARDTRHRLRINDICQACHEN